MIKDRNLLLSMAGSESVSTTINDEPYKLVIETSAYCSANCPACVNARAYVSLAANRLFREALEVIRESNPFPGICGRICSHPCELNCRLAEDGEAVSIRALKRFIADYEVSRQPLSGKPLPVCHEEKIAVIGSGPAGLTTAVDLAKFGYQMVVFEAMDRPGGMLAWGIPEFRLPGKILDREIKLIENMGIRIETRRKIEDPESLLKKGYDAVVLAAGTWKGSKLNIDGEEQEGVIDGLVFLKEVRKGKFNELAGRVIVIGGGNTALDVARTAVRLGTKKVTIVYRRTRNEMPASRSEIEEALEEGIQILPLSIPVRVLSDNRRVTGIVLQRTELGEIDETGRRKPIAVEGSESILECDMIIPAISSQPDLNPGKLKGISIDNRGRILVDETYQTSLKRIFAVGDVIHGPTSVVHVIGDAHRCARAIDSVLRESELKAGFSELCKNAGLILLKDNFKATKRSTPPKQNPELRIHSLNREVELPFQERDAVREAQRCNGCGPCSLCSICLATCKYKQVLATFGNEEALLKVPGEVSFGIHSTNSSLMKLTLNGAENEIQLKSLTPSINTDQCIACGLCETACAYRAIRMQIRIAGQAFAVLDHDTCRSCGRCVYSCPTGAISFSLFENSRLEDKIESSLNANRGIAVFSSYWLPSISKQGLDHVIEVMSADSLRLFPLLTALSAGARGILIFDTLKNHYLPCHSSLDETVGRIKEILTLVGINPEIIGFSRSNDQQAELGRFISKLDGLQLSSPGRLKNKTNPKKLSTVIQLLDGLTSLDREVIDNSLILKCRIIKEMGFLCADRLLDSIREISERLHPEEFALKKDIQEQSIKVRTDLLTDESLLSSIDKSLTGIDLKSDVLNVGIECRSSDRDSVFIQLLEDLLGKIENVTTAGLRVFDCPDLLKTSLNADLGKLALHELKEWECKDADLVITASLDSLVLFEAVNGGSAWKRSPVRMTDIFTFLSQLLRET